MFLMPMFLMPMFSMHREGRKHLSDEIYLPTLITQKHGLEAWLRNNMRFYGVDYFVDYSLDSSIGIT